MIHGVTHDDEGAPIQRPIVNRKLGVGRPPGYENKPYPQRLTHFITSVRSRDKNDKGGFIEDIGFTKLLQSIYGSPLTELDVVLLDDDPEKVLKTEYAYRQQNRGNALLCHGDGRQAARRWEFLTPAEKVAYGGTRDPKSWVHILDIKRLEPDVLETIHPKTQVIPACGDDRKAGGLICPHLLEHKCKPSADLFFMFPEDPITGSISTLHTSSWEATRRLSSSLYDIFEMVAKNGGRLRGLRLKLVARPYKSTFKDKDGKDDVQTQLAFNLEFRHNDYKQIDTALIDESRRLVSSVPAGADIEGLDDDTIAVEFNPTAEQEEAKRRDEKQQEQKAPTGRPAALNKVVQHNQAQQEGITNHLPAHLWHSKPEDPSIVGKPVEQQKPEPVKKQPFDRESI